MTVHSDPMANDRMADIEDIKLRGAKVPASDSLCAFYREAFRDYGVRALWSSRPVERPTIADLLAITESLRVEGGVPGRRLAQRIVEACRAAHSSSVPSVAPVGVAPESRKLCGGGGAVGARSGPRSSHDIDVFDDRELALQEAVKADTDLLQQKGFQIEFTRRFPTIVTAVIRSGDDGTLLEWVVDSAYRFFPALQDELFAYVLHPADIATNKALAAAGRREPRDIIDLLHIHEHYLPLGAVAWAASAKDPGLSPEGIIAEIGRHGRYEQADYDRLQHETRIDAAATAQALRTVLDEAEAFVWRMPAGTEGLLFLCTSGQPVQPDPTRLESYTAHGGQLRGHWPSSPEITRAMMERYNQRPKR